MNLNVADDQHAQIAMRRELLTQQVIDDAVPGDVGTVRMGFIPLSGQRQLEQSDGQTRQNVYPVRDLQTIVLVE